MVKIRLRRMGSKKRPFYRIVAADSRSPRDGRFIEMLGSYDPNADPPVVTLKKDRVQYWLDNGAQPTDTARALLKAEGLLGGATQRAAEPEAEEKPAKAPARKRAAKPETEEAEKAATEAVAQEQAEPANAEADVAEEEPKSKRARKAPEPSESVAEEAGESGAAEPAGEDQAEPQE